MESKDAAMVGDSPTKSVGAELAATKIPLLSILELEPTART